jgi:hypothetical protein
MIENNAIGAKDYKIIKNPNLTKNELYVESR